MTATGPALTIAAKSGFAPVTGDVLVLFDAGKASKKQAHLAKAQIHGTISGAINGEVARLFAQPFPFKHAPARIASLTLTRSTAPYSFTVAPALATRYQVEVFSNRTATTPLAASATRTVFVSNLMLTPLPGPCSHPVCRQKIHVQEFVPASALRDEISKRWFFYLGVSLSLPKFLTLDTHATISRSTQTGASSFVRTISFSFRIGTSNHGIFYYNLCSKDTEAGDGLGLPGRHSCGAKRISTAVEYLG